jgi:hypothetical protein
VAVAANNEEVKSHTKQMVTAKSIRSKHQLPQN